MCRGGKCRCSMMSVVCIRLSSSALLLMDLLAGAGIKGIISSPATTHGNRVATVRRVQFPLSVPERMPRVLRVGQPRLTIRQRSTIPALLMTRRHSHIVISQHAMSLWSFFCRVDSAPDVGLMFGHCYDHRALPRRTNSPVKCYGVLPSILNVEYWDYRLDYTECMLLVSNAS